VLGAPVNSPMRSPAEKLDKSFVPPDDSAVHTESATSSALPRLPAHGAPPGPDTGASAANDLDTGAGLSPGLIESGLLNASAAAETSSSRVGVPVGFSTQSPSPAPRIDGSSVGAGENLSGPSSSSSGGCLLSVTPSVQKCYNTPQEESTPLFDNVGTGKAPTSSPHTSSGSGSSQNLRTDGKRPPPAG
jgi:hypothetical protein